MADRYAFGHDVVGRAGSGVDQISLTGTPLPTHVPMRGVNHTDVVGAVFAILS